MTTKIEDAVKVLNDVADAVERGASHRGDANLIREAIATLQQREAGAVAWEVTRNTQHGATVTVVHGRRRPEIRDAAYFVRPLIYGDTPAQAASQEGELVAKLQAFKDYTHQRLDAMGIPVDPDSPHKDAGCRIGGRMDLVEQRIAHPAADKVLGQHGEQISVLRRICARGRNLFLDKGDSVGVDMFEHMETEVGRLAAALSQPNGESDGR